jgi:hypothetical protein
MTGFHLIRCFRWLAADGGWCQHPSIQSDFSTTLSAQYSDVDDPGLRPVACRAT